MSQKDVILIFFFHFVYFLDTLLPLIFLCRSKSYQLYYLNSSPVLHSWSLARSIQIWSSSITYGIAWGPLLYYMCCYWGVKNYPILFPLFRKGAIGTKPELLHLCMKTHPVCFSLQIWPECKITSEMAPFLYLTNKLSLWMNIWWLNI